MTHLITYENQSRVIFFTVGRKRASVCVYVHVCACIIKRGSYLTSHTPLLPFILATHETRINAKSVFSAFNVLIFFLSRTASPSSLFHFFLGISQVKMSDRTTGGFTFSILMVSHVLFFIFGNYHKNSLNQFDLFVHLIAQWGSN